MSTGFEPSTKDDAFPSAPKLARGAVVEHDGSASNEIPFQYNPESVRRTLTPATIGGDQQANRSQAVRFTGAPVQEISLEILLDATARDKDGTATYPEGIYPMLNRLELLAYPKTDAVENYAKTLRQGAVQVLPLEAPSLFFSWGKLRYMPVRLTSIVVNEEVFDPDLKPLRARVELSMRVLTYSDVHIDSGAAKSFLKYQKDLVARSGR